MPQPAAQPSLEAQVADHSDEIAYTNHDLDDGLRAGLITLEELDEIPLWRETRRRVRAGTDATRERILRAQTIIALINQLVTDLAEETGRRLSRFAPGDVEAVRAQPERLVGFSEEQGAQLARLKQFLNQRFYNHPTVLEMSAPAERVIGDLFRHYRDDTRELPAHVRQRFETDGVERAIADYVAGMTDRFALQEHQRWKAAS